MKFFLKLVIFLFIVVLIITCLTSQALFFSQKVANTNMSDFYNFDDDIDILFIGPSTFYYGINTYYIDAITGGNSFVFATPSQRIDLTYFMVKEAIREKNIKTIVMGAYGFSGSGKTPEHLLLAAFYNTKFRMNKIEMMNHYDSISFTDLIYPFDNVHGYIYEDPNMNWNFYDRNGFKGKFKTIDEFEHEFQDLTNVEMVEVPEDQVEMLKEIIKLCDKENIELKFISMPYANYDPETTLNVVETTGKALYLMDKLDIEIINYNYLIEELGLTENHFCDKTHLNINGARIVSKRIAQDLGGDISNLDNVKDFVVTDIKSRSYMKHILYDDTLGKGFEFSSNPNSSAKRFTNMLKIRLLDEKVRGSGLYEFSVILHFDKAINNDTIQNFVTTTKQEDIEYTNVKNIGDGYYKVTLGVELDTDSVDLKNYFRLTKIMDHITVKIFKPSLKKAD